MAIVKMVDVRAGDYCSRGAREWFTQRGLDWGLFLKQGIDAEQLRSFGDDAMVDTIIQYAEARECQENQAGK